ncbi:hypothetical protein C8Q76DRAFT_688229 [Earliella scabrosa]|nr:hypothetical protein C8Q76DRAFT_688229 [Earliella scabrosa]
MQPVRERSRPQALLGPPSPRPFVPARPSPLRESFAPQSESQSQASDPGADEDPVPFSDYSPQDTIMPCGDYPVTLREEDARNRELVGGFDHWRDSAPFDAEDWEEEAEAEEDSEPRGAFARDSVFEQEADVLGMPTASGVRMTMAASLELFRHKIREYGEQGREGEYELYARSAELRLESLMLVDNVATEHNTSRLSSKDG